MAATDLKKRGFDIAVVFVEEALSALVKNRFELSPLLEEDRDKIFGSWERKGRPTSIKGLIKMAKEVDVAVYACKGWVENLGIAKGELPEGVEVIEMSDFYAMLAHARSVIGTL
jgi:predicted peroxiredoxin